MHDSLIKHIITAKFQVSPNARFLTCQLCNASVEYFVKLRDPTLVLLGQCLIINMGIADENVIHL